jgi:hypothetical protein
MTEENHSNPARRRRFLPWRQLLAHQTDAGLADDLRDLLPAETTDSLDDPWQTARNQRPEEPGATVRQAHNAADPDNSATLDP